jgi:hypothetical protein
VDGDIDHAVKFHHLHVERRGQSARYNRRREEVQMQILVDALSAMMAVVAIALISANLYVMVATALHKRKSAMRFLSHFSRAVMFLRLSDSITPSRPYRRR